MGISGFCSLNFRASRARTACCCARRLFEGLSGRVWRLGDWTLWPVRKAWWLAGVGEVAENVVPATWRRRPRLARLKTL